MYFSGHCPVIRSLQYNTLLLIMILNGYMITLEAFADYERGRDQTA